MPLPLSAPATATGIGSLPGTDPRKAAATVAEQLPEFPHVPELPQRGPGADMVGRTLGLLCEVAPDFSATTTVTGWELSAASRDMRRARSLLGEDLDAVEQLWAGHTGLAKQQLAGPVTLAAAVERRGRKLLADAGLVRELVEAWAVMAAHHRTVLRTRLPAQWLLQMDEPALPAAAAGTIRSLSGLSTYPAFTAALPSADLLHCCAAGLPWSRLPEVAAVLVDAGQSLPGEEQPLAELATRGVTLGFGVPGDAGSVRRVLDFYDRTGLAPAPVLVTPPCGMVADYTPWRRITEELTGRWG